MGDYDFGTVEMTPAGKMWMDAVARAEKAESRLALAEAVIAKADVVRMNAPECGDPDCDYDCAYCMMLAAYDTAREAMK